MTTERHGELSIDGDRAIDARGFLPGTHAFLDRLDAHLSKTTLPTWSTRYEELASSYPAWA